MSHVCVRRGLHEMRTPSGWAGGWGLEIRPSNDSVGDSTRLALQTQLERQGVETPFQRPVESQLIPESRQSLNIGEGSGEELILVSLAVWHGVC